MKIYSWKNCVLLVNGVDINGMGEGDNDVLQISTLTETITHEIGIDGNMVLSLSADLSGSVKFRLQQTSNANKYLSGIVNLARNGLFVPVAVQFTDLESNDTISGVNGYIKKPADMNRGGKAQSQEWEIILERIDMFHIGE